MNRLITLFAFSAAVLSRSAAAEQAQSAPAFGWPFSGAYNVTAGYDLDPVDVIRADWTGWREGEPTAGNGHSYDDHTGHDFGMPTDTNLYAVAAGRVFGLREIIPNDDHSDTGNYLILDHRAATGTAVGGLDYRSRYWHLAQNGALPTGTGVAVTKGQHVAESDNTGNSTGPHLHYAIARLPNDNSTCAFYHGWWEADEFFTANTRPCLVYLNTGSDFLNVREGNTGTYNIITSLPPNTRVVATQQNTWWRAMLPLPPATVQESRTAPGGLAPTYTEGGTWADWPHKAAVPEPAGDPNQVIPVATGSRTSTFDTLGDPAATATWNPTLPYQRGLYDIYATWPANANAKNVTYRVTHGAGITDVLVDQRGNTAPAGTGTKASPHLIMQNPYVVNHTTVGAPDEWDLYTPQGSNLPQNGPENLYRFDLVKPGTVTVTVDHTGYSTKDIDIHLLNALSPGACIQRADWTFTSTVLAAGTYYIACDSYGSGAAGNNAAVAYKLTVSFSEDQPFPNSWVKLGQFTYPPGAFCNVQLRESSVTGPHNPAQPGRVVADAIKIVPRITRRTGWISNGFATRINTVSTPVASVVIKTDKSADSDTRSIEDYAEVPIYLAAGIGTTNSSPIVGKAVTGQRFVCNLRNGDWYQVDLTNGTAATTGWILGNHLIGYNLNQASDVDEWPLY